MTVVPDSGVFPGLGQRLGRMGLAEPEQHPTEAEAYLTACKHSFTMQERRRYRRRRKALRKRGIVLP